MSTSSKVKKNVVVALLGHVFVMILGLIVPRLMITKYGSDSNGLLNTINQIFGYMALMEAGIGQAAKNALFKPISEDDRAGVSHYTSVANEYYRRITLLYGLGVIAFALLAPYFIKTSLSGGTIVLIVLLQGMSGVISFYFIQTITVVLGAYGREYVSNAFSIVNTIITYAVKIILALNGISIVLLQLSHFLITIAKVFFFRAYFKKHFGWIDYHQADKTEKLPHRNDYILTEIAWTVFSSTDMIILSSVVNTKLSSVYAVYNMVFANLNSLLSAVYFSVVYLLGLTFHHDRKEYARLHDAYTTIFFGGMTILMATSYILCIPFVRLYTVGVHDVEYIIPQLPLMFCMVQEFSWSRFVAGNLSGVAGYAKPVSRISLIEAFLNIGLSLILVKNYGIIGVLFATVITLPIKCCYLIWLSEKVILKRSPFRYLLILGANYALFGAAVVANHFISLPIANYYDFFVYGVIVFAIFGIVGAGLNYLVNPDCLRVLAEIRNKKYE